MPNCIEEKCQEIITPIVTGLGYEIVEIEYLQKGKYADLTIFIYKQGGISLDDCEAVSKAIDGPLDDADVTSGKPYNLLVSSPGLDRPIVSNDDYRRNVGVEVEAVLVAPLEKKKKLVGTISSYDDENVTLDIKNTQVTLKRDNIKTLKAFIRFE